MHALLNAGIHNTNMKVVSKGTLPSIGCLLYKALGVTPVRTPDARGDQVVRPSPCLDATVQHSSRH